MIYLLKDVMGKLENCIKYRKPFSHIRFGDGGIKLIHSILEPDYEQLRIIMKKEGLPQPKIIEIFELWGYYARRADFIDTPEVYFNDTFWPREKKPGKAINKPTEEKLRNWRQLYHDAEFDNESYCNPETNFLMILKRENKPNLMDFMKGKRICLITARPQVKSVLDGYDIDIVEIVAHYENQYRNSFCDVMNIIRSKAQDYDFWMVAAGELGRIYTGEIKENGGRAIDIGFVIEFWLGGELHPRFLQFMERANQHELILTETGRKYEEYI